MYDGYRLEEDATAHLIFAYMGLRVNSEVCSTSDGRADAVVETPARVYVLEFKLDESAEAALEQIRQKRATMKPSGILGSPLHRS